VTLAKAGVTLANDDTITSFGNGSAVPSVATGPRHELLPSTHGRRV